MKSVRDQQETLVAKERELDHMTNERNQSKADAEALKIAYEKMITVKDKEIKELEEMATSKVCIYIYTYI
jgi:hypothetical protein